MSSVNIYFTFYRNIKFYSKTSFSTWFDSSRIQICWVKTIIITSTNNGGSFASSRFGKLNFFCDFAGSKGQKYSRNMCILFCRPTKHNNVYYYTSPMFDER